ncbi:MAG: alpha/beta hydrolase [Microbacteriaceae bacterium]
MTDRFPLRSLLVAGVAAAMLLSGCVAVPPPPGGGVTTTTTPPEQVAPELQVYYDQELQWTDCGNGNLCADAQAPMDWDNPSSGDIWLAMVKTPASGKKIGSLFTNPGGPGASGFDFVYDYSQFIFGKDVLASYDIVGWDPRGVGQSSAVKCFVDDADKNRFLFEDEIDAKWGEPGYLPEVEMAYDYFIDACLDDTEELLGYVDTVSTAHDLDLMRALVGDSKLNYVGFSYGAYLGGVYADEFAEKVGRVVIDGPVNPAISLTDLVIEQNQGFEVGYQQFLANCLAGKDCPFTGTIEEATQQTIDLLARLEESPLRAKDGRKLWGGSFTLSIASALYAEFTWPMLRTAIKDVMNGDAELAFNLIDSYHGRNPDGSFNDNSYEANIAINCLDYPVSRDIERWNRDFDRLKELSPLLGPYGGYSELLCDMWPYQAKHERKAITASGSDPIIVVGSVYDTATPYRWAEELAATLENGTLLTRDGQGHTSYGQGNRCIDGAVDAYLLHGTVPAKGTVC